MFDYLGWAAAGAPPGAAPACRFFLPLIIAISYTRVNGRRQWISNLHHASAGERDNQHEHPLGHEVENPEKVAKGDRQAKLGGLAIEGVEPRVEEGEGLLVASLLQLDKLLRSNGGKVKPLLVDVDGGRLGEHLEGPEVADVGGPGIAEDGLVVAVENAHVRGVWELCKLGCRLVEGGFNLVTVA